MSAQPASRPPRVVRIVSQDEAESRLWRGIRNVLPAALLMWFLLWALVFVGLQVPLLWVRP